MLLEPFSSVSAQIALETVGGGGCEGRFLEVETPPPPPPPPLLTPTPLLPPPPTALLPPPTQCCPPISPLCTPVSSYWRSQPLAGRLRAIRPMLVGYVYGVCDRWKLFFMRKMEILRSKRTSRHPNIKKIQIFRPSPPKRTPPPKMSRGYTILTRAVISGTYMNSHLWKSVANCQHVRKAICWKFSIRGSSEIDITVFLRV